MLVCPGSWSFNDHQPSWLQHSHQREWRVSAEAAEAAGLQPVHQTHWHLDVSIVPLEEVHHHRLGLHPGEWVSVWTRNIRKQSLLKLADCSCRLLLQTVLEFRDSRRWMLPSCPLRSVTSTTSGGCDPPCSVLGGTGEESTPVRYTLRVWNHGRNVRGTIKVQNLDCAGLNYSGPVMVSGHFQLRWVLSFLVIFWLQRFWSLGRVIAATVLSYFLSR